MFFFFFFNRLNWTVRRTRTHKSRADIIYYVQRDTITHTIIWWWYYCDRARVYYNNNVLICVPIRHRAKWVRVRTRGAPWLIFPACVIAGTDRETNESRVIRLVKYRQSIFFFFFGLACAFGGEENSLSPPPRRCLRDVCCWIAGARLGVRQNQRGRVLIYNIIYCIWESNKLH